MKPQEINLGDYNDMVQLYHGESDRAAAVMAGSFVEHHLAVFLKSFLVEDPEVGELFHGFGPLSSFAQRISMAAAIGLIDSGCRSELHAIKEIRNHFAHHPVQASFDDSVLDKHFHKFSVSHDPGFNCGGDGPLKNRRLIYLFSVGRIVLQFEKAIFRKRFATLPVFTAGAAVVICGQVVPDSPLPEGAHVEIRTQPAGDAAPELPDGTTFGCPVE